MGNMKKKIAKTKAGPRGTWRTITASEKHLKKIMKKKKVVAAPVPKIPKPTKEQELFFLTVLKDDNIWLHKKPVPKQKNWYTREGLEQVVKLERLKPDLDNHFLYVKWCSGGVGGGGWQEGDCNYYATSGEPEPEFKDLDAILTAICPNITYLQYKHLMATVKIIRDDWSENEYYGNSSNYTYKAILLRDLLNTFVEMKLLKV